VCTTIPQGEIRAAERIREMLCPGDCGEKALAYVPCEFFWRRPQRANLRMPRREYQRPRMRHYIFVGIPGGMTDAWLSALRERDVEGRNVHGLVSILGTPDGKPLRLNDKGLDWVEDLAREETAGRTDVTGSELQPDETLRVTAGPFAMFTGRMVALDAESGHCIVELSLMGRKTDVRMALEDVERAA
jgi:transcriptional antiterminator NusG